MKTLMFPSVRIVLVAAVAAGGLQAQVVTELIRLDASNGVPNSLVQGSDGNLYGTTSAVNRSSELIFKLTPNGVFTAVYQFTASSAVGTNTRGGLLQLTDGAFYGTTGIGGAKGFGTIFKAAADGTVTPLYAFGTNSTDGTGSASGLLLASDGNFYGTTMFGGHNNLGTVFRCTPGGQYTTLYSFGTQANDGGGPTGRLIQAKDGNIYGTTSGITGYLLNTSSTVFRITTAGVFTTLHTFGGQASFPVVPYAGLIQGSDGNFYGTTQPGVEKQFGTVFRMNAAGTVTLIHSFPGNDEFSVGPLLQAGDGNYYGTTATTIFRVTPAGDFSTVYTFNTFISSTSSLIQASDGNVYGYGLRSSDTLGSIFKMFLAPNPPPPAPTITPGGVVPINSNVPTIQSGEWISIYGTNLASATAVWSGDFPRSLANTTVTINGKQAFLWYVSPTQINLQAPGDTAIGSVSVVVTTPGGSATAAVTIAQFAPSFCLLDSKHIAGIILRTDGSGAYGGGAYDIIGPTGKSLGYNTAAASAGDTVEIFAVGLGPTNPVVPPGTVFSGSAPTTSTITILINNISVTPLYAGETSAGLYQITFKIPPGIGTGDLTLQAIAGETPNGVVISLQ
jgi:uncharacterized protein (TIGR03437 family)